MTLMLAPMLNNKAVICKVLHKGLSLWIRPLDKPGSEHVVGILAVVHVLIQINIVGPNRDTGFKNTKLAGHPI